MCSVSHMAHMVVCSVLTLLQYVIMLPFFLARRPFTFAPGLAGRRLKFSALQDHQGRQRSSTVFIRFFPRYTTRDIHVIMFSKLEHLSGKGLIDLIYADHNQFKIPIKEESFANWRKNGCAVHAARILLDGWLNIPPTARSVTRSLLHSDVIYHELLRERYDKSLHKNRFEPNELLSEDQNRLNKINFVLAKTTDFFDSEELIPGMSRVKHGNRVFKFKAGHHPTNFCNVGITVSAQVKTYFDNQSNYLLITRSSKTSSVMHVDNSFYFYDSHGRKAVLAKFRSEIVFLNFLESVYSIPHSELNPFDISPIDFDEVSSLTYAVCDHCRLVDCICSKSGCKKNKHHADSHCALSGAVQVLLPKNDNAQAESSLGNKRKKTDKRTNNFPFRSVPKGKKICPNCEQLINRFKPIHDCPDPLTQTSTHVKAATTVAVSDYMSERAVGPLEFHQGVDFGKSQLTLNQGDAGQVGRDVSAFPLNFPSSQGNNSDLGNKGTKRKCPSSSTPMKRDSSVFASLSMPEKVSPINSPEKSDVDGVFKIPCTPTFVPDSFSSDVTLENCSQSENIQDDLYDFNSKSAQGVNELNFDSSSEFDTVSLDKKSISGDDPNNSRQGSVHDLSLGFKELPRSKSPVTYGLCDHGKMRVSHLEVSCSECNEEGLSLSMRARCSFCHVVDCLCSKSGCKKSKHHADSHRALSGAKKRLLHKNDTSQVEDDISSPNSQGNKSYKKRHIPKGKKICPNCGELINRFISIHDCPDPLTQTFTQVKAPTTVTNSSNQVNENLTLGQGDAEVGRDVSASLNSSLTNKATKRKRGNPNSSFGSNVSDGLAGRDVSASLNSSLTNKVTKRKRGDPNSSFGSNVSDGLPKVQKPYRVIWSTRKSVLGRIIKTKPPCIFCSKQNCNKKECENLEWFKSAVEPHILTDFELNKVSVKCDPKILETDTKSLRKKCKVPKCDYCLKWKASCKCDQHRNIAYDTFIRNIASDFAINQKDQNALEGLLDRVDDDIDEEECFAALQNKGIALYISHCASDISFNDLNVPEQDANAFSSPRPFVPQIDTSMSAQSAVGSVQLSLTQSSEIQASTSSPSVSQALHENVVDSLQASELHACDDEDCVGNCARRKIPVINHYVYRRKVIFPEGEYTSIGRHVNNNFVVDIGVLRKFKNACPHCRRIRCRRYWCRFNYSKRQKGSGKSINFPEMPAVEVDTEVNYENPPFCSSNEPNSLRKRINLSSHCICSLQATVSCDRCGKRQRIETVEDIPSLPSVQTDDGTVKRKLPGSEHSLVCSSHVPGTCDCYSADSIAERSVIDQVGDEVMNAGTEVLSDEYSVQTELIPRKNSRKRNRSSSEQSVCTRQSPDASLSTSQLTGLENSDINNLSSHSNQILQGDSANSPESSNMFRVVSLSDSDLDLGFSDSDVVSLHPPSHEEDEIYVPPTCVTFYDYAPDFIDNKVSIDPGLLDRLHQKHKDNPSLPIHTEIHMEPEYFENLEQYSETVNLRNVDQCGCCHRFNNPVAPISFTTLGNNEFQPRIYGDPSILLADSSDTPLQERKICSCCFKYLQKSSHQVYRSTAIYAWPALIHTYLTDRRYKEEAKKILEFLDINIKKQFVLANILPEFRHIIETPGQAADITCRLRTHEAQRKLGTAASIKKMLNREGFETIKCPAGCNAHISEDFDLLPIHHAMQKIYPRFFAFNADQNYLRGARSDWLMKHKFGPWTSRVGTIIDEKKGLCLLVCKKHSTLRNRYCHVPRNPVEGHYDNIPYDPLATVVSSANIVRSGRSSKGRSASFGVVNQRINHGGTSVFSLALDGNRRLHQSDFRMALDYVIYKNREDIRQYVDSGSNPFFPKDYFKELEETVTYHNPYSYPYPSPAKVEECASTGNYTPYFQTLSLVRIQTGSEYLDHQSAMMDAYNVDIIPYGETLLTFKALAHNKRIKKELQFAVLSLLRTITLHNWNIYRDLFFSSFGSSASEILKKFIASITGNKRESNYIYQNIRVLAGELHDEMKALFDEYESLHPHECAMKVFQHFGLRVKIFASKDEASAYDSTISDEFEYLMYAESDADSSAPIEIPGFSFMMSATSDITRQGISEVVAARSDPLTDIFYTLEKGGVDRTNFAHCTQNCKIFVQTKAISGLKENESTNYYGDRKFLKCQRHSDFLQSNLDKKDIRCCHENCSKRCDTFCGRVEHGADFEEEAQVCHIGLCKKHGELLVNRRREQCFVAPKSTLDQAVLNDPVVERDDLEEPTSDDEHSVPVAEHETRGPIAMLYQSPLDECGMNLHSESNRPVVSNSERVYNKVAASYILNNNLGVRGHTNTKIKHNRTHHMVQKQLYSRNRDRSEVLTHPEFALFPENFIKGAGEERIGALHTPLLSRYGDTPKSGNASFADHAAVRLSDLSSLTSQNVNYATFLHECNVNRLTRDSGQSHILKRGLEGIANARYNKTRIESEGRPNHEYELLKLSHMTRDLKHWDLFLTLTANTQATPGLAPISWVINNFFRTEKLRKDLIQNNAGLFCRIWSRVVHAVIVDYIFSGSEKPLGEVLAYWYRFENQSAGSPGNLPHVHGGITLRTKESYDSLLKKTSCRLDDLIGSHDCSQSKLLEDGLFQSQDAYWKTVDIIDSCRKHTCRAKCTKIIDGVKYCRNRKFPVRHRGEVKIKHDLWDDDAQKIFEELEVHGDDRLRAHYFEYANDRDGVTLSTNGKIAFLLGSATNVQVCDARFSTAYCLKYASGKDESREIVFKVDEEDDAITVEAKQLYNSKISRCAYSHKNMRKRKKLPEKAQVNEIPLTDLLWFENGLEYVCTNVQDIFISTEPYVCRGGQIRNPNAYKRLVGNALPPFRPSDILSIENRKNLPEWRRFTSNQVNQITDIIQSRYIVSRMDQFSLRPPELLDVNNPRLYHRWFSVKSSNSNCNISDEFTTTYLLDGTNSVVKFRQQYVNEVLDFYQSLDSDDPRVSEIQNLLAGLSSALAEAGGDTSHFNRWLDATNTNPVVVIFSKNDPYHADKFLVSFLLKHGSYECEADLFDVENLKKSFSRSGLLPDVPFYDLTHVNKLLRIYIFEELLFQAFSSVKISRYLTQAKQVFTDFLVNGEIFTGVPLVLERAIQESASQELQEMEQEISNSILKALRSEIELPDNIHGYVPRLVSLPGQSEASLNEQKNALNVCMNAIDKMLDENRHHIRSPTLHGAPGCGKTYLLYQTLAYALGKGLRVLTMALTSQRAQMLGGYHMHSVFCIPVDKTQLTPNYNSLADKAMNNLMRSPVKFCFLKRLDAIFFDEIGMISNADLGMMDHILRRVKGIKKPYGGCLFYSSGDNRQIKPIAGGSVWRSNLLITSHDVLYLKHPVRCAGDDHLESFIRKCRENLPYNSPKLKIVMSHLREGIPEDNFKPSWNDLNDPYIFKIVSTKAAMREADEMYVQNRLEESVPHFVVHAVDHFRDTKTENWSLVPESSRLLNIIDQHYDGIEKTLYLFKDSIMSLTKNNNSPTVNFPRFSQGQCVLIKELPTDQNPYCVGKLLKAGANEIPGDVDDLPTIRIAVKPFQTFTHKDRHYRVLLRRSQMPLRYNNCTTIHKVIGKTLPKIATQITKKSDDHRYFLWDKEMFIVLMTRTCSLDRIFFVGKRNDTLAVMRNILSQQDNLSDYIDSRIQSLDVLQSSDCTRIVEPFPSVFFPSMYTIPEEDDCGYVGLIISRKNPGFFQVVHCDSIGQEIRSLNDANGLGFDSTFRPYTFGIYIFGFPSNDCRIQRLQYYIQIKNQFRFAISIFGEHLTWEMAIHLFRMIHASFMPVVDKKEDYTLVQCIPTTTSYAVDFYKFLKDRLVDSIYQQIVDRREITY